MKDTLNLFQKFVAFLNEVSQEAEGVASEAAKDETNSGEVSLKYYLDDEHYFEVDGEGFVRDENGELIAEGEYRLADGNVFQVDANGKFIGTVAVSEGEDEQVEAPIAEGFKEEEKEDEGKDDKDDGESEPKADETPSEDAGEDSKEDGEDSGEEDKKDDKLEEEEPKKDEDEEEKPMINAIPYSIGGTEYLLPVEVINYIESLISTKVEVEEKLTKLADETPSAMPVGNVVKNGEAPEDSINDRIANLSSFRGFGRRV